jgi:hypothetical protein
METLTPSSTAVPVCASVRGSREVGRPASLPRLGELFSEYPVPILDAFLVQGFGPGPGLACVKAVHG